MLESSFQTPFYLSNKLEKVDQRYKGDWQGLYSFDLQSRTHVKIADKDSLRFPTPNVQGSITSLVGASADLRAHLDHRKHCHNMSKSDSLCE
jgi:hypothetical protein